MGKSRVVTGNERGKHFGRGHGALANSGTCVVEGLEERRYMAGTPLRLEEVVAEGGKQLVILGSNGADNIKLSSRDGRLTVRNGTWSRTVNHVYDSVRVDGRQGNDTIAVGSAFTTKTILAGGAGNDTIAGGAGEDRMYGGGGNDVMSGNAGGDTLVSIGGGDRDKLAGGTGKDAFWMDGGALEAAGDVSGAERAAGAVHRVGAFANGVSKEQGAQDLADPSDAGTTQSFDGYALFSEDGPALADIRQGALGDCYFLTALGSLAEHDQQIIRQSVVDLGDGTYAVRFYAGTAERYYRVDSDLPVSGTSPRYAQLGVGESMWVAVMEKAFAFHRRGAGTYASIEGGWMSEVFTDLGAESQTWSYNDLYSSDYMVEVMSWALGHGGAVTIGTIGDLEGMVGGHAYAVTGVYYDPQAGEYKVRLYNPWAQDGYACADGNDDGYVCVSAAAGWQNFAAVQVSFG